MTDCPTPDRLPQRGHFELLDNLTRQASGEVHGRLVDAVRAALDVHGAIDAVQYLGPRAIPRHVCTGCGSDDGNWQLWPCPTVRAITTALNEESRL